jgi:serine/threonine protein kinase
MEEQSFGSYKVVKKIGAGGMARVFLAVHKDIPNLKVVLKILSDPNLVERFKQEADKLALLDGHPNICQIKHFFNHGEDMVIAMEYIDGVTLDDKMKVSGKFPIPDAMKIVSEVLDILEFAHQKGIYHRDIKPSNIMIDNSGRVKIIDFGIAKAKTDPNLTTVGTACGTPAYMAPEQFVPNDETDYAKIDIYATGTTLYYMLTNQLPFKGDNEFVLRDAKLFTNPIKPRDANSEITKPLEEIILKSLKKDPQERYHSATEMKNALDHLRIKKETETELIRPSGKQPDPRPSSKLKWFIAAGVAIIAIIAIILLMQPSGKHEETQKPPPDTLKTDPTIKMDTVTTIAERPTGLVAISITPSGDIFFDNHLHTKGASFTSITSDTGWHSIRIQNHQAINKEIVDSIYLETNKANTKKYSFQMPQIATSANNSTTPQGSDISTIIIGSKPMGGAKIYIDGVFQEKRQTPNTFKLKPGRHDIRVVLPLENGDKIKDSTVFLSENDTFRVIFDFEN